MTRRKGNLPPIREGKGTGGEVGNPFFGKKMKVGRESRQGKGGKSRKRNRRKRRWGEERERKG